MRMTLALVWRSSPPRPSLWRVLTLVGGARARSGSPTRASASSTPSSRDSRDATVRWVLVELGLVVALALVQRGLGLVRSVLGARLGIDINVTHPREGPGPRPAVLRGPRVLRQAHAGAARGVVAAHRARHRELRPRAERHHARRLRRAARSRFSGWAVLGALRSRPSPRPSPRCASRSSPSASETGARPSRGGSSTSSTCSRTTSTRRR